MPVENEMTKEQYLKAAKKLEREKWENEFARQLDIEGWDYQREFRFHPVRRWRTDFIIRDPAIARWVLGIEDSILVDLQGGIWSGGVHVRGLGYKNDIEKMNAATAIGWRVFWFTSGMVEDGSAIEFLREEVWK